MIELDQVHTLAFAGVMLFLGYGLRRCVPGLLKYNVPAPVVGGLLVACIVGSVRTEAGAPVSFDTALQTPLMIAFFTSIGFGASLSLLRIGGPAVLLFLVVSAIMAVFQNALGAAVAVLLGQDALVGVLAGSVTLTGGPATGLAFAPEFERAGIAAAATIAVAAAMAGIVAGGVVGGPVGTWLVGRGGHTRLPAPPAREERGASDVFIEPREPQIADTDAYTLLKAVVLILSAMSVGAWIGRSFAAWNITLPAYIGAMLAAAALRNFDDLTSSIGISLHRVDELGATALSLFLVMALMTLKLSDLVGLALPLAIMLILQVAAVAVVAAGFVFRLMGRDYEAAVMSSGFCGFMLGTTANAMANMNALVERYGPAPKAFLVVPIVGAFFIDFVNALIITGFLNLLR